jgi:hypothetical protein
VTPLTVTQTDLPAVTAANAFTLTAVNLKSVRLDASRMGLTGGARYSIQTDGPLEILFSDGRKLALPAAGQHEGSL